MTASPTDPGTVRRLMAKVDIDPVGCWKWTGATNRTGYGVMKAGSRTVRVHRVTFSLFVGAIPDGHEIDHLCRNRACVNPSHLEAVTHAENVARAAAARTHCKQGHPYDEENTYMRRSGWRGCRACQKRWRQEGRSDG